MQKAVLFYCNLKLSYQASKSGYTFVVNLRVWLTISHFYYLTNGRDYKQSSQFLLWKH